MTGRSFTTAITVRKSAQEAFDAINRPRDWWGQDIDGRIDRVGAEWTYRYKDMHHSRQRTAELVPEQKIVWDVIDCRMSFLKDETEWNGTRIMFEIAPKNGKTEIRFTHKGLNPDFECFDICSNAWTGLIQDSLRKLIETGSGRPDTVE